ncbi:MAG: YbaN family protein [Cypionkella sp.]|uniref:YbaN family protein n=1 Tax=Cypionkella sp. TaxID=2811411 RepID=UPI002717C496|nr:YbaN family protein [Cypionkella sp.]MDO8326408.1 YbaN family protein [Cypionkella sp.]
MRVIWLLVGLLSVAMAVVGAFLPLLPTVPFLLLAAICFSKSSDRLHVWLIQHGRLGPPIKAWQNSGSISLPAKWMASLSVLAAIGISLLLGLSWRILLIQAIALVCVMAFIWTRPSE